MSNSDDYATQLDDLIENNDVLVLSKSWCPYCASTKSTLRSYDAEPKVLELDEMTEGSKLQSAMTSREGHRTVPGVWIKQKFIGGNSDLQKLVKNGELKQLLA